MTDQAATDQAGGGSAFLRLDKWLFFARFCKSRQLAAALCESGRLRIGGAIVSKPHYKLRVGDVLTFPQGRFIRVVKVEALGRRRGPAEEAKTLYEDLSPPDAQPPLPRQAVAAAPHREPGAGRPTKRERRDIERLRDEE
ncbi:heat shock protein Hsp15 [Tistlia consotensis]|uniref:Heat shock protein Hsp15 n=1 Tax=Tistlia consotensis USBA 355 TaxID=560819 RepID=A0A1Y6CN00_9PROT|nr:RNA-binding S4 domain-containing protein [Tistlia consotensis]SMF78889.1 heat shock protein Hsp15 [Tistlia consotensis USBA 355]SNS15078.1 heat shock protein Hsp15 [Tistlia consotensis]